MIARDMQEHTKIYFDGMAFDFTEFVPCEIGRDNYEHCENKAVDVHHIDARGMGGNPTKSRDNIFNLMGLCGRCHRDFGDITDFKDLLKSIHVHRMKERGTYERELNKQNQENDH